MDFGASTWFKKDELYGTVSEIVSFKRWCGYGQHWLQPLVHLLIIWLKADSGKLESPLQRRKWPVWASACLPGISDWLGDTKPGWLHSGLLHLRPGARNFSFFIFLFFFKKSNLSLFLWHWGLNLGLHISRQAPYHWAVFPSRRSYFFSLGQDLT